MNKTKIEWCSHTWNPITGCLHGCDYCYARRQVARFQPHGTERPMPDDNGNTGLVEGWPRTLLCSTTRPVNLMDETGAFVRSTPYPKGFSPTFHSYKLDEPAKHKTPARIFVCSMADLFGEWVPDEWIRQVFAACKQAPQHTYMFLTKNPARYRKLALRFELPFDNNFWYGSTVTDDKTPYFFSGSHNCFVSVEPLLFEFDRPSVEALTGVNWIIIGVMTGPGCKKHQPERQWIEAIAEEAHRVSVPVFMKDSLAPILGDDLIQEYPPEMQRVQITTADLPRCRGCEYASTVQHGKRGTSYFCEIGWDAAGYDDRGARHILGRYTRTSPPWCPKRNEMEAQ